MLARLAKRVWGHGPLPTDLVAAIEVAQVTPRGEPDPETGEQRVMVKLSSVGAFYLDGIEDAAERIGRAWPELPAHSALAPPDCCWTMPPAICGRPRPPHGGLDGYGTGEVMV